MELSVPYNFEPRDYQLELLQAMDSGLKRAILRWPRRAGKDTVCFNYMIKEAMKRPGNYFYIFPTKEDARRALWDKVDPNSGFRLLDHLLYPDSQLPKGQKYIKRLSNQEMSITLSNGATVKVLGLDKNPDAIRGVAAAGVVFSEFAFADPEAYKNLVPSLREAKGWSIFNSTPNGRNHYYEMFEAVKTEPDWYVSYFQTRWPEGENYREIISPEELDTIKKQEGYDDARLDREYGCCFDTSMVGSYYHDQVEVAYKEQRIGHYEYDPMYPVDTYWDVGLSDSTAIWFTQEIQDRIVFIDYFETNKTDIKNVVEELQDKGYRYGTHYVPHDAGNRQNSGKGYLESTASLLEQLCYNYNISDQVVVNNKPVGTTKGAAVQTEIYKVRALFPRFYFNQTRCALGLKYIDQYRRKYDKFRKDYMDIPYHDFTSHAADALRSYVQAKDMSRPKRRVNVNTHFDIFD